MKSPRKSLSKDDRIATATYDLSSSQLEDDDSDEITSEDLKRAGKRFLDALIRGLLGGACAQGGLNLISLAFSLVKGRKTSREKLWTLFCVQPMR